MHNRKGEGGGARPHSLLPGCTGCSRTSSGWRSRLSRVPPQAHPSLPRRVRVPLEPAATLPIGVRYVERGRDKKNRYRIFSQRWRARSASPAPGGALKISSTLRRAAGSGRSPVTTMVVSSTRSFTSANSSAARRVVGMQADAAVRGRPAEMRDLVGAVDGVAAVEEDRIGHRRPVVFAREPFARQPLRLVGAVGRAVAHARGRHRPFVARRAIDRDRRGAAPFCPRSRRCRPWRAQGRRTARR